MLNRITLNQELRDELLRILTYREDWLNHLFYYGGMTGLLASEIDWRFEKGELFDSYGTLAQKLEEIAFDGVETEDFDLTDNEVCVCGWYFKRLILDDRRPFSLSLELRRAFFDISHEARVKGQKMHLPFNGKIGHRLILPKEKQQAA